MKKITSALLCVLLAALLCLGGCQISSGTHGRGTTTLSAEQLLADWNAIAEDDVTVEAGSVTEWLILRGLTGFDTYALSRLEGAYADYADAHEADLPTPEAAGKQVARTLADRLAHGLFDPHDEDALTGEVTSALRVFVDERLGLTLPVETVLLAERFEAMAADAAPSSARTVTAWLVAHGLGGFITGKLQAVEQCYASYFIREVPDPATVGTRMAETLAACLREGLFDPTSESRLTDYLIAAYQDAVGDKYAVYLDSESYPLYSTDVSGEYEGIGVTVQYEADTGSLLIISVQPDSPADLVGMRAGDRITHVDGQSVASLGYYGAILRVRGDAGTSVSLTVVRGDETLTLVPVRAALTEQTVFWHTEELEVPGDDAVTVGYIQVTSFEDVTKAQFTRAVDALLLVPVKALVIDLRNNGGGLVDTCECLMDYLLPDGRTLVSFAYYDGTAEDYVGQDGHAVDMPLAVVVNQYSASASEMFASALRDYAAEGWAEAFVVGHVTFGKGTMQGQIAFTDGTAITISIGMFQPPSGVNFEGVGVTPGILSENDPEFDGYDPADLTPAQDRQLAAAYAALLAALAQ